MSITIKGKQAFQSRHIVNWLSDNIEAGSSLLDLGCGPKLYSSPFKDICSKILTVDAWDWVEPDIVANLELESVLDVVKNEKFDYILMLDFIEHLDKEKGLKLIEDCKQICNKKIFLLTPLEEIWTDNHEHVENEDLWCYGNTFDLHKSVWAKSDFPDWTEVSIKKFGRFYSGYWSNEK